MPTGTVLSVGMAEIKVAKGPVVYSCLGLGSCIGLCAIDAASGVSGMVHIMLPEAFKDKPVEKPGKFADTGLPEMLKLMEKQGADLGRLQVAYAGGAQVFNFGASADSRLDVGARNATAVEALVLKLRLRVLGKDVGGSSGRTVTVDTSTGVCTVRTVKAGEAELCRLKSV